MSEQNACVIGMQWGDEGKGKIIDLLSKDFDVVVRTQGGSNAGHTVVVGDDKFVLHLVPSGILRDGAVCVVGNGVVVDPEQLLNEIEELSGRGVRVAGKLLVSDRAHAVMPYHKALDAAKENALGDKKIGTTLRGIGPAYGDKIARSGLRLGDLIDADACRAKLEQHVPFVNKMLQNVYGAEPVDLAEIIDWAGRMGEAVRPMVGDTVAFLHEASAAGKSILFEGAQGSLLDADFGTYPFNTSSNSSVGGMVTGSGLPPKAIGRIVGIIKAYTTRVGSGPFPTELDEEIGALLRANGNEFGATTGRPRRCGWFDAVAARYSAMINGTDALAITKLDVLDGINPLKICVAYEIDGQRTEVFPAQIDKLAAARPVYEEIEGWDGSATSDESASGLCPAAEAYIARISSLTGAPAAIISVGSERDQTLTR